MHDRRSRIGVESRVRKINLRKHQHGHNRCHQQGKKHPGCRIELQMAHALSKLRSPRKARQLPESAIFRAVFPAVRQLSPEAKATVSVRMLRVSPHIRLLVLIVAVGSPVWAQAPRKLSPKDLPASAFKLVAINVSGTKRYSQAEIKI